MLVDNFKLAGQGEDVAKQVAELVVKEITNGRAQRQVNLTKNFDMYEGHHAKYFKQRIKEPDDIFQYRKDNPTISNKVEFVVNLSARYLYGRASKVIRKFSKDVKTQERLTKLSKQIEIDTFLLDAAKKGANFGKVTSRFVAVDAMTGLQANGTSTETTYPHPILLDPLNTYVKRNKWGKIIAVVIKYKATDYGKAKSSHITELIVDDSRWMWVDEGAIGEALGALSMSLPSSLSNGKFIRQKNLYKLSDEFVDLLNNQDERSDIEDIMDLNIAYDEALTDDKHFFSKHGWPQLISEVSLENVIHSPNRIWEIIPDGGDDKKVMDKLGFLTWEGKRAEHKAYMDNLERLIHIQSNTAAISTGDLEAIGQLRSGAALITAHSVAIHKTEEKQLTWEKNEKAFFRALINFDSQIHGEKPESRYADFNPVIKFPRDFVPGAEHERAQIQQIQINSHTRPLRAILTENDPECVNEDVLEEQYKEVMEDSRNISDSTRTFEAGAESPAAKGPTGKSGTSMQKSKEQK